MEVLAQRGGGVDEGLAVDVAEGDSALVDQELLVLLPLGGDVGGVALGGLGGAVLDDGLVLGSQAVPELA